MKLQDRTGKGQDREQDRWSYRTGKRQVKGQDRGQVELQRTGQVDLQDFLPRNFERELK